MKKPRIVDMILEQYTKELENEWRPPRVGSSYRGSELGDCSRAIQYLTQGRVQSPIPPEVSAIFRDGHMHHEQLRSVLSSIGTVTNSEHHTSKKYIVSYKGIDYPITITTTCDLIFNRDFIGELKSINTFSFKGLDKARVLERYRHYYHQLQAYLDVYDKEWGFLLFKDKNSGALKLFWFKRNPKALKNILQKLVIIEHANATKKMIKKPFTKSSWDCKICRVRRHCWGSDPVRRPWR